MFAVVERFPNRFNDGVIPTRSVGRSMARQVKSVSIPERLQERVQDIPNFTQWVIAALDNPQASEAVSSAATNRRVHLLHLEHLLADLEDIRTDLFTMLRQKKRGYVDARYVDKLAEAMDDIIDDWAATAKRMRRQS